MKGRIIRDIKTLFEQQEEDYYKLVKVGKFWNYNYTEYESSVDRNINIWIVKITLTKLNLIWEI